MCRCRIHPPHIKVYGEKQCRILIDKETETYRWQGMDSVFLCVQLKKVIEISPVGACMEYIKMLSCYLIKI